MHRGRAFNLRLDKPTQERPSSAPLNLVQAAIQVDPSDFVRRELWWGWGVLQWIVSLAVKVRRRGAQHPRESVKALSPILLALEKAADRGLVQAGLLSHFRMAELRSGKPLCKAFRIDPVKHG